MLAIGVRAGWGGAAARALEGATLFLAAAAYLAHVLAHHETAPRAADPLDPGERVRACGDSCRSRPDCPTNAVLNDVVIVLFVVDLAILVSPWL